MPKTFEDTLKELADKAVNAPVPQMTEELIVVHGLLALIIDVQLRHKQAIKKGSTCPPS